MRRLAALVLLAALLGAFPAGAQTATPVVRPIEGAYPPETVPDAPASDLDPADVHTPAVACLYWWGLASGFADGTFRPGQVVTRGQLASFTARFLDGAGLPPPPAVGDAFRDDDGSVHEPSIDVLNARGVYGIFSANPRSPGLHLVRPDAPATRAEASEVLWVSASFALRLSAPLVADAVYFDDSAGVAGADALAAAGLAAGVGPRRFAPERPLTRAQLATFLARALDLLVEEGRVELPG